MHATISEHLDGTITVDGEYFVTTERGLERRFTYTAKSDYGPILKGVLKSSADFWLRCIAGVERSRAKRGAAPMVWED